MTQEEKDLLLKDICARLPYGVKCDRYGNSYKLVDIDIERELVYLLRDEQYVYLLKTLHISIEKYNKDLNKPH